MHSFNRYFLVTFEIQDIVLDATKHHSCISTVPVLKRPTYIEERGITFGQGES